MKFPVLRAWYDQQNPRRSTEVRRFPAMSADAYANLFSFNGHQYVAPGPYKAMAARSLACSCGPVAAVLDRRVSVMGEARPAFQRLRAGQPDGLFSNRDLKILEVPWPGGSWRQLVAACEADVAACGNSYWIKQGNELIRLNPDWVTIVLSDVLEAGVKVGERLLGYAVEQPGKSKEVVALDPDKVAHYRPGASTESQFRGESWLTSVLLDASSDVEMTSYKGNYLKNGAMPSIAVTYEPTIDQEMLEAFVPVFASKFTGSLNAGKVMHFLGGRDVKTVGASLDDLAFKAVQGAGETRIAAAAGVPAVVAGFSEGLSGSSLNAGNYVATRRLFADAKIRPLLGALCDAFANLVTVPSDGKLWFDDSGVSFFQEDVGDEAQIRLTMASTIEQLIRSGYEPDAVVLAVTTGRFDALVGEHSGLMSVQLTPPGTETPPTTNGTEPAPEGETDD